MRKILFAGAAAAMLVGGAAMAAEAVVTITPAHRTAIKSFIVKQHVSPVTVRERVVVGGVLPQTVELQQFPDTFYTDVPEVQPYQYVDIDGQIYLVDPSTRKVVEIIQ